MASAQRSTRTQNRTYYYRLQTLLVDGGALVLRRVFDEKKTHFLLDACLIHYKQHIWRHLNRQQRAMLYPPPGCVPTSDDFDISLLACLLRYMCGLRNSNDPVWSNEPQADCSVEADITRLRLARNKFAHSFSTFEISESDFESLWLEIEQALIRLNAGIQNGVPNLPSKLTKIKQDPLDPQADARLKQEIKLWEEMDDSMTRDINQKLEEYGDDLKNMSAMMTKGNSQNCRIERNTSEVLQKLNDLKISSIQSKVDQDVISKNTNDINERQEQTLQGQEKLHEDFTNLNSALHRMASDVKSMDNKMDPKLSPEQKSLHDISQMYFEDAEAETQIYVKTGAYDEARKKLQKSGLVILSGHPGEGKTAMAMHLLLETAPIKKLLRLSGPADWRLVDIDGYNAVLIDDLFGTGILDEQLLCQWGEYFPEIRLAVERKQLSSVVITTRHYILKDAKKIRRLEIFKDDDITTLSSSKLTNQEKHRILVNHLIKNNRIVESSLYSVEYPLNSSIGFPECAVMFASTDSLFNKGPNFFSSPVEFFRKCITDLSKKEDEFKALVLVWARPSKKMPIEDLERKHISRLQDIGDDFDYSIDKHSRSVKMYLEHHKDEFLIFNLKTGEYSFSHHVISDVVGLVAAEDNPKAVLRHGSKDFIMRYITTEEDKPREEFLIHIHEFLYPALIDKICHLLYENEEDKNNMPNYYDIRLKEEGIENSKIFRGSTTDRTIVKHDAFRNKNFIRCFVTTLTNHDRKYKLVSRPMVDVYELFKTKYCIEFESGELSMCLPSLLLAKGNQLLVEECLSQSVLTDDERYISLLLATRKGDLDLVQKLTDRETPINDDAIQIASVKQDVDVLKLLLQSGSNSKSHIQNGNSPLIMAAKKGCLDMVKCLLDGGADVNYRNLSKVSALDKAVCSNKTEICRELLMNGANVNEKGGKFDRTPLHTAVDIGLTDTVNLMLEFGADVFTQDHRGDYPVHSAAVQGHTEILRLLLERNRSQAILKLNSHGKENLRGMTLYHFAVLKESWNLFEILKEFKVDPNLQDRYGRTPLYFAVCHGKKYFVDLLLDIADPVRPEKNGYTPLHVAVFKHHIDIVKTLCRHVNANLRDKRGFTPLHLACKTVQLGVIKVLLMESNADVRMKTKKGETVFHILKTAFEKTTGMVTTIARCAKAILCKDPHFRTILEGLERRGEIDPILQTILDLENETTGP